MKATDVQENLTLLLNQQHRLCRNKRSMLYTLFWAPFMPISSREPKNIVLFKAPSQEESIGKHAIYSGKLLFLL